MALFIEDPHLQPAHLGLPPIYNTHRFPRLCRSVAHFPFPAGHCLRTCPTSWPICRLKLVRRVETGAASTCLFLWWKKPRHSSRNTVSLGPFLSSGGLCGWVLETICPNAIGGVGDLSGCPLSPPPPAARPLLTTGRHFLVFRPDLGYACIPCDTHDQLGPCEPFLDARFGTRYRKAVTAASGAGLESATYRHNWRTDGVPRRNVWRKVDNRFFLRLVIDLVDTAVDSSRGGSRLLANHRGYGCDASLGSPSPSPVSRHPSTPTATSSSSTPSSASSSADPPRTLLRGILSQQPGVPLGLNLHALQPGHPALRPAATNGSNGEYHHHHHGHPNPHGKPGKSPFTDGMIRLDGRRSCWPFCGAARRVGRAGNEMSTDQILIGHPGRHNPLSGRTLDGGRPSAAFCDMLAQPSVATWCLRFGKKSDRTQPMVR
jgi:hypothetical protein